MEPEQIQDKEIIITGSDVNHIKNVIRLKVGDEISISNGIDGRDYRCGIAQITEDEVRCELRFIKEDGVELPVKVCLFQGLPKGDKMELIVQKMVELGVYEIVPVTMKRCVMKLDDKKAKNKIARWQGIAEAASKQSKRGIVPQIHEGHDLQRGISICQNHAASACSIRNGRKPGRRIRHGRNKSGNRGSTTRGYGRCLYPIGGWLCRG